MFRFTDFFNKPSASKQAFKEQDNNSASETDSASDSDDYTARRSNPKKKRHSRRKPVPKTKTTNATYNEDWSSDSDSDSEASYASSSDDDATIGVERYFRRSSKGPVNSIKPEVEWSRKVPKDLAPISGRAPLVGANAGQHPYLRSHSNPMSVGSKLLTTADASDAIAAMDGVGSGIQGSRTIFGEAGSSDDPYQSSNPMENKKKFTTMTNMLGETIECYENEHLPGPTTQKGRIYDKEHFATQSNPMLVYAQGGIDANAPIRHKREFVRPDVDVMEKTPQDIANLIREESQYRANVDSYFNRNGEMVTGTAQWELRKPMDYHDVINRVQNETKDRLKQTKREEESNLHMGTPDLMQPLGGGIASERAAPVRNALRTAGLHEAILRRSHFYYRKNGLEDIKTVAYHLRSDASFQMAAVESKNFDHNNSKGGLHSSAKWTVSGENADGTNAIHVTALRNVSQERNETQRSKQDIRKMAATALMQNVSNTQLGDGSRKEYKGDRSNERLLQAAPGTQLARTNYDTTGINLHDRPQKENDTISSDTRGLYDSLLAMTTTGIETAQMIQPAGPVQGQFEETTKSGGLESHMALNVVALDGATGTDVGGIQINMMNLRQRNPDDHNNMKRGLDAARIDNAVVDPLANMNNFAGFRSSKPSEHADTRRGVDASAPNTSTITTQFHSVGIRSSKPSDHEDTNRGTDAAMVNTNSAQVQVGLTGSGLTSAFRQVQPSDRATNIKTTEEPARFDKNVQLIGNQVGAVRNREQQRIDTENRGLNTSVSATMSQGVQIADGQASAGQVRPRQLLDDTLRNQQGAQGSKLVIAGNVTFVNSNVQDQNYTNMASQQKQDHVDTQRSTVDHARVAQQNIVNNIQTVTQAAPLRDQGAFDSRVTNRYQAQQDGKNQYRPGVGGISNSQLDAGQVDQKADRHSVRNEYRGTAVNYVAPSGAQVSSDGNTGMILDGGQKVMRSNEFGMKRAESSEHDPTRRGMAPVQVTSRPQTPVGFEGAVGGNGFGLVPTGAQPRWVGIDTRMSQRQ